MNGNAFAFGQLREPLPARESVSFWVPLPKTDARFRVTVRHAKKSRVPGE